MGTIYKRGNIWWIQYYRNGKPYQESSKSKKKMVARSLLELREGEKAQGKAPGVTYEKTMYEDLREAILIDYEVNGKRIDRLVNSLDHLDGYFEGLRGPQITTSQVQVYINERIKWTCKKCKEKIVSNDRCPFCESDRLKPGASNATINRELAALKRMLNLGYQSDRVARVPHIPMLKEDNVRQGFFEHDEYLALLKALPSSLRPVAIFAYHTGWRKREVLDLTWDRVNLNERTVALTPDQTKNKEARDLYLNDELLKLFKLQHLKKGKCPYVFHRDGVRIKCFRKAWKNACKDAGIEGKLFHDFRRTAVRNLTRSGTKETVAMKITGHKTRSVFDRYNITSGDDIKQAMVRQAGYLLLETTAETATIGEK
jgi:integrase